MTRLVLLAALAVPLVACNAPPTKAVMPGMSVAPSVPTKAFDACGMDVSWSGGEIDLRYQLTYDTLGRIDRARGTYTRGGPDEILEYTWDNLDRMVLLVETRGTVRSNTTEAVYNTLGDMLEYTDANGHYVFSEFTDAGQPTREQIVAGRVETGYTLEYDPFQRIVRTLSDAGEQTIYTYDDDARTSTIVSGAYTGTVIYDDRDRTLSTSWVGAADGMIASEELYEYAGDRMLTYTARQGTTDAPTVLQTVEIDTYRYDCATRD